MKARVKSNSLKLNKIPRRNKISSYPAGRLFASAVFLPALLIFLAGCVGLKIPEEKSIPSQIYREGSVLLSLKVRNNRELAEQVFSLLVDPKKGGSVLERTRRIYIRLYQAETSKKANIEVVDVESNSLVFDAVAVGKYPFRLAGGALKKSGWEKMDGRYSRWNHTEGKMELAFPSTRLAAVSIDGMDELLRQLEHINETPETMRSEKEDRQAVGSRGSLDSSKGLPSAAARQAEKSPLYIYGRRPRFNSFYSRGLTVLFSKLVEFEMSFASAEESLRGTSDNQEKKTSEKTGAEGETSKEVLSIDGPQYVLSGSYRFEKQSTARSFLLSLRLALLGRAREKGKEAVKRLLEEKYVSQEKNTVLIRGAPINSEDVDMIFGVFAPRFK